MGVCVSWFEVSKRDGWCGWVGDWEGIPRWEVEEVVGG